MGKIWRGDKKLRGADDLNAGRRAFFESGKFGGAWVGLCRFDINPLAWDGCDDFLYDRFRLRMGFAVGEKNGA